MNVKETASTIVKKYLTIIVEELSGSDNIYIYTAKQCAKAEVQAIINSKPISPLKSNYVMLESEQLDEAREFWQDVLKEIK